MTADSDPKVRRSGGPEEIPRLTDLVQGKDRRRRQVRRAARPRPADADPADRPPGPGKPSDARNEDGEDGHSVDCYA